MKLDRNINPDGRGKYALVKLRQLNTHTNNKAYNAVADLTSEGMIDFGNTPDTEFFVIRLKDKFAGPALHAYAEAAKHEDPEWSGQVRALAFAADQLPVKQRPT